MPTQAYNGSNRFENKSFYERLLGECPLSCPGSQCLIDCQCKDECPKDFTAILIAITVLAVVAIVLALVCYLCRKERKASRQARLQVFEIPANFEIDSSRTNLKGEHHDLPTLLNSAARLPVDVPVKAPTISHVRDTGGVWPQIAGNGIFQANPNNIIFQIQSAPFQISLNTSDRSIGNLGTHSESNNTFCNNYKIETNVNQKDYEKNQPTDKSVLKVLTESDEENDNSNIVLPKTQEGHQESKTIGSLHIKDINMQHINHHVKDDNDNLTHKSTPKEAQEDQKDNHNLANVDASVLLADIGLEQNRNDKLVEEKLATQSIEQNSNLDIILDNVQQEQQENNITSIIEPNIKNANTFNLDKKLDDDMDIEDYEHDKINESEAKKDATQEKKEDDNLISQELLIGQQIMFAFAEDLDKKENEEV